MADEEPEFATAAPEHLRNSNEKRVPDTQSTPGNKSVWMGTAVGIGSAALVAALLYAKRRK